MALPRPDGLDLMQSGSGAIALAQLPELTAMRSRILDHFILINALALSLMLLPALFEARPIGGHWSLPLTTGCIAGLWILWLFRQRVHFRPRAWWLLGLCWVIALSSILNLGPVAYTKGYCVLLTLATTLFLGSRIGWLNVGAVGFAVSGIGVGAALGWISLPLDCAADVRLPVAWVQNTFGLTVLSASSTLIAGHFLNSLTAAARALVQRIRDLSADKARLRAALRRQRAINDTSAVGIAMIDGNGCFADINTGFARMLGWSRRDLLGQRSTLIHLDAAVGTASWERLAAGRGRRRTDSIDCQIRRRNGKPVWCQLSLTPLDPASMAGGAMLVLVDIDQRIHTQGQLLAARLAAERAMRASNRCLAMVSHDLRTPLHALLGFAELLAAGGAWTATQADLLQGIRRNGGSLRYLVDELLEFSRGATGKRRIRAVPCVLEPVFERALEQVRQRAQAKGLELRMDLPEALPGPVLIDAERLLQVLGNLLDNAVKFTDRGTVSLSASARSAVADPGRCELIITVADSGRGIGADDQTRIFEPFERVGESPERPGAGLGLAICRQLVEAMAGLIQVESRLGVGSRFQVRFARLPIVAGAPPARLAGAGGPPVPADPGAGLPPGALPMLPPALAAQLLATAAPRWRDLTPDLPPAAVADFVAGIAGLARIHACPPLQAWAEGLARLLQGAGPPTLRAWWADFARFLWEPPPRSALNELRGLAELGLISHIEHWCHHWGGRDPRYAGFVGAVLAAAYTFEPARLIELIDALDGAAAEDEAS